MSIPERYVDDIVSKYGSIKYFMKLYKSGKIEYKFGKDVFVGYRGVTISEQEMTQEQKLRFAVLGEEFKDYRKGVEKGKINFEDGDYIDIDALTLALDGLDERDRNIIQWHYGLNGEKLTLAQIGKNLNISRSRVQKIKEDGIKKMVRISGYLEKKIIGNVQAELQQCESEKRDLEARIRRVEAIASYITDENGKPKKELEDISLEEFGISFWGASRGALIRSDEVGDLVDRKDITTREEMQNLFRINNITTIYKLIEAIYESEEANKRKEFQRRDEMDFQEMGFSERVLGCLKRAGISTLSELVSRTEDGLLQIMNFGPSALDEVKIRLARKGLELGAKAKIDAQSNGEPKKSKIEILANRCTMLLGQYQERVAELDQNENGKLAEELRRYNEAKDNYMNSEDIFDSQGEVLPVKSIGEEEKSDKCDYPRVAEMGFSVRTYNALCQNGVTHVTQLLELSEQELALKRGIGTEVIKEIKLKLSENGLQLKRDSKTTTDIESIFDTSNLGKMSIEGLELIHHGIQDSIVGARSVLMNDRKEALIQSIQAGYKELEELKRKAREIGISIG